MTKHIYDYEVLVNEEGYVTRIFDKNFCRKHAFKFESNCNAHVRHDHVKFTTLKHGVYSGCWMIA